MVRREKEGAGQLNGEKLRIEERLTLGGYETDSGVDTLDSEILVPSSVEVKVGDPEADAPRLLQLYIHQSVVEHLEGIVPSSYTETDPNTQEERIIPATTADDIREKYSNPNITLLKVQGPSGIIVATCAVQKLSHNVAEIGTLVVSRNYRKKGLGADLIRTANALAFREDTGGFDCRLVQAFVIVGVPGYHIAQNAFRRQGFLGKSEREQSTRSWSNELMRLVDRNSQPMELTRKAYIQDFPGDHIAYFPGQRLPKVA